MFTNRRTLSIGATSTCAFFRCAFLLGAAALVIFNNCPVASAAEVITVRSGQFLGLPGAPNNFDDIVTYYTENQVAPIATVFDSEFATADSGPSALVVTPHPFWLPFLPADPLARWINWSIDLGSGGLGIPPASALYSVPFTVTTPGTSSATLQVYFAADDVLGDTGFGGPNPEGMYLNGTPLLASFGGNIGAQTLYTANVTVNQGVNRLYLYDRDVGAAVSGVLFSATITVPEPASWMLILSGSGLALLARRMKRRTVV